MARQNRNDLPSAAIITEDTNFVPAFLVLFAGLAIALISYNVKSSEKKREEP